MFCTLVSFVFLSSLTHFLYEAHIRSVQKVPRIHVQPSVKTMWRPCDGQLRFSKLLDPVTVFPFSLDVLCC